MPFRVRLSEAAQQQFELLPVDVLRAVRAKLEQVAEMSEGFPPVSPLWSRRMDVDVARMRVHVAGYLVEFEIDSPNESVRVLSITPESAESGSPVRR